MAVLSVLGLFFTFLLYVRGIRGSIPLGVLVTAAGIISYPIVKAARGDWSGVSAGQWLLAGAFVLYFFVRTSGVLQGQL